jgi:phosphatidylglycerophosphate synthase
MDRGKLLTVPNSLSISRLGLAVAFVLVDTNRARIGLIAVAGLTDFLDGWIARHDNSQTSSGAIIDPFADRVFVLAAVSSYLVHEILSTNQYFLFISRDLATAIGFLVAKLVPWLKPVEFKARLLGKIVTVLQLTGLVAVLLFPEHTGLFIDAVALFSAGAIVDYTLALWRARVR